MSIVAVPPPPPPPPPHETRASHNPTAAMAVLRMLPPEIVKTSRDVVSSASILRRSFSYVKYSLGRSRYEIDMIQCDGGTSAPLFRRRR